MSDTVLDNDISLDHSEIGKRFLFWEPVFPDDAVVSFSSTLENIGVLEKHDRRLKNKTEVIALSDPTEARHATKGPILVTKIMAHDIMWVHTWSLRWIDER
jgi:hypothetical protein